MATTASAQEQPLFDMPEPTSPFAPLKPNPYANLSPEEQAKLPLSAQLPDIKEQVSIDISPEIPRPNEVVTIRAQTYGIDIDSAEINWVLNGASALKGTGQKTFAFTAGEGGKTSFVELFIYPKYGSLIYRSFKFNPSEVDVLWQANTYTPPFYKGKALYTNQADLQFVAMPNITNARGVKLQPGNTIYDWKIDYRAYADKSGYGRNFYNFTGSILGGDTSVRVTAKDPNNLESVGVGQLHISPTEPIVLMYEVHPVYGPLFNMAAVGNYNFGEQDIQLAAYPYFFSASSKRDLKYTWNINSIPVNVPANQNVIGLQRVKAEKGQSTVSVLTNSTDHFLQESHGSINLFY